MVISNNVGSLVSMDVKDYVNPRKVFVASGETKLATFRCLKWHSLKIVSILLEAMFQNWTIQNIEIWH